MLLSGLGSVVVEVAVAVLLAEGTAVASTVAVSVTVCDVPAGMSPIVQTPVPAL